MKKLLLTLAAVVLGFTAANAQTTITMSDIATSVNGGSADYTISGSGFTFNIKKNNGATNPTYNTTVKDLRTYAKATIEVVSTSAMTDIVFNLSTQGKKRLAPITASVGTIATQAAGDATVTWTGSATSVTFTVGDKANYGSDGDTKAGQLDFTSVVITVAGGGSIVVKDNAEMSFPEATYTVKFGDAFNAPKVNKATDAEPVYSSDKEAVATVDPATGDVTIVGVGTAIITATCAETEKFAAGSASYTLTVIDPNGPAVVTINAADLSGLATDKNVTAQGFTFDVEKNNGQTAPTLNGDYRIYAKGSLNIIAPEDLQIVNVVFAISSNGKKRLTSITASEGSIATQAYGDTQVSWSGNANSVTFTVGEKAIYGSDGKNKAGQLCFDNVKITYIYKAKKPVVSHNKNQVTITPEEVGAKIYYTVDGSDVDVANATLYVGPFAIDKTTTVKAVAVVEGKANSAQHVYVAEYIAAPTATWESKNTEDHHASGVLDASTMDLDGIHGGIIITITAPEGCALWYSLTQGESNSITKAPVMYANVNNDFTAVDVPLTKVDSGKATDILVQKQGKLTYYSENAKGIQSHDVVVNFSGQTGVEDIIADENNGEVEFFNLQGVRVANPENGVYIRRQGNKATKVLVK